MAQDFKELEHKMPPESLARAKLGYEPKFDLRAGIAAYHASGKLGA